MSKKGRKILDGALKLLRPSTVGGAAIDLADNTPLGYYQAVKAGKKNISYGPRGAGSKPGEFVNYQTVPFAEGADANFTRAKLSVSKRCITGISATGLTTALLNIDDTESALATAVELVGFRPATATVRVLTTGTKTTTSKLTNRAYASKNASSYTLPFGAGVAIADTDIAEGYKGMKAKILTAVEAGGAVRSVSFKPEAY